jgi:hypothetical protein
MFTHLGINDLARIAAAGGGFKLRAGHFATNDLVRLAAAAGSGGAKLTLQGLGHLDVNDLVRIAAAGQGNVVFERRDD